jgi:hypothetical protein
VTEAEMIAQFKEAGIRVTTTGHLVSEADLARSLDVVSRTVQRWREDGSGPVPSFVGGRWMYSCGAVAEWLDECAQARPAATKRDRS